MKPDNIHTLPPQNSETVVITVGGRTVRVTIGAKVEEVQPKPPAEVVEFPKPKS